MDALRLSQTSERLIPAALEVNDATRTIIEQAINMNGIGGAHIPPGAAKLAVANIERAEQTMRQVGRRAAADKLREISQSMRQVWSSTDGVNVLGKTGSPREQARLEAEEFIHSALQTRAGSGIPREGIPTEALSQNPSIQAMTSRIEGAYGRSVEPFQVVAEAFVNAVLREAAELSPEESDHFIERYADAIAEKVGPEWLDSAQRFFQELADDAAKLGPEAREVAEHERRAAETVGRIKVRRNERQAPQAAPGVRAPGSDGGALGRPYRGGQERNGVREVERAGASEENQALGGKLHAGLPLNEAFRQDKGLAQRALGRVIAKRGGGQLGPKSASGGVAPPRPRSGPRGGGSGTSSVAPVGAPQGTGLPEVLPALFGLSGKSELQPKSGSSVPPFIRLIRVRAL
jgi:hypothetical protein